MEIVINERKTQALELHRKIIVGAEIVALGLVELGKDLKYMRDEKLYLELGYEEFGEYSYEMVKIGQRQAYSFISVYEQYGTKKLEEYAHFGITKLSDLLQVPAIERDEFIENNDIENVSTRRLKELIAENKGLTEQLSLLTEAKDTEKENLQNVEDLELQIKDEQEKYHTLETKLKELEEKPIEVAVAEPSAEDIATATEKATKDIQEKHKAELEKLKTVAADEKQKLIVENNKKIEDAKADAIKELEVKFEELEVEKADALKRADKIASKASLTNDADIIKYSVYFDSLVSVVSSPCDELIGIEHEKSKKCRNAVLMYLQSTAIPMFEEDLNV